MSSTMKSCIRTLGERLAYFRKSAGLQLGEAAALTAISKSELSRLENDGRTLTGAHRAVLAKAYGVDLRQLEIALAFDPLTQAAHQVAETEGDFLFRARRDLPCYSAETFPDLPERPPTITLAMDIPLSQAGYAIRLESAADIFLPEAALIVADPMARTVLGDLVVNVLDRSALLLTLYRNEAGALAGRRGDASVTFPDRVGVTAFHKVVAVFPAPHLMCL